MDGDEAAVVCIEILEHSEQAILFVSLVLVHGGGDELVEVNVAAAVDDRSLRELLKRVPVPDLVLPRLAPDPPSACSMPLWTNPGSTSSS